MKKAISITVLIIMVVLCGQLLITKLTKKHLFKYIINNNETKYSIVEKYLKNNGDAYDIEISDGTNSFYYVIANSFNKQKKIITDIEVYKDGDNICIYPILKDNTPAYIECINNGSLYSGIAYSNQNFINEIKNDLKAKGYTLSGINEDAGVKNYGSMTLNTNYLSDKDSIVLWQYKGILVMDKDNETSIMNNGFDKYDNKLGVLVDKYYVMPDYNNQNILEAYSLDIVDLNNYKEHKIELGFVLSSNTYVNGVINNKIYYTDPSNLIQVEVDPKSKKVKVIGNQEMGGKKYLNGKWEDANIYDFTTSEIRFTDIPDINFPHSSIVDGGAAYYYVNDGNLYQLLKDHLDNPILMYRVGSINNLMALSDEVFYVSNNTMYCLSNIKGILPVFINNDLIYNTNNRVNVYRKK